MRYVLDVRGIPAAQFCRGHARRACPRRRALRAGNLVDAELKRRSSVFAGRPYAEVAVEVIQPFVGDSSLKADLACMAREKFGTFRHPATAPLVQLGDSLFVLEPFR